MLHWRCVGLRVVTGRGGTNSSPEISLSSSSSTILDVQLELLARLLLLTLATHNTILQHLPIKQVYELVLVLLWASCSHLCACVGACDLVVGVDS